MSTTVQPVHSDGVTHSPIRHTWAQRPYGPEPEKGDPALCGFSHPDSPVLTSLPYRKGIPPADCVVCADLARQLRSR